MNKKIISLVLALVMVLGTFTSVFAEAAKEATAKKEEVKKTETKKAEAGEKVEKVVGKDNKIQYVIDKKLVEGYEDGTYGLDKNIKRSEITRLLVLANGNEELSKQLQGSMKIYSDVDAKHWANGVITVGTTVPSDANGIAMLAGYPDGSFKPEKDVTYAELAKMLVVLAKKDLTADMVKNAKWASDWMTWAAQLGILNDVTVNDSDKAANRADAFTMIYNALYTMKEFKRVPANETRGIISNFSKNTLQLNQDSKMEYKVNADTVFVTGKNNAYSQIQKIGQLNLSAKSYYLGSLVRILTNDKNEVTHIIELGNPAKLALTHKDDANGNGPALVAKNTVWRDVAENTIETVNKEVRTADQAQAKINDGECYATINFNDNKIKANSIVFHNAGQKDAKVELKLTDKTEFYVANPANNIMKKVANVNEALALIGYQNYKEYKLAGVYAGYDTDGIKSNYGAIKYDTAERNTAKVVVFNFVNKAYEGEKFRVVEGPSSNGTLTLENTDGKLMDSNQLSNITTFPLSYSAKLDVVSVIGQNIKTVIDHSNTKDFPIVKITKVMNDGKVIYVTDGVSTSKLDLREADIFSAERYAKVAEGTLVQFKADGYSNTIEVLSLLGNEKTPANNVKMDGYLKGVVPTASEELRVAKVIAVQKVGNEQVAYLDLYRDALDADAQSYNVPFVVGDDDAQVLKDHFVGKNLKISFDTTLTKGVEKRIAFNILENDSQLPIATYIEKRDVVEKEMAKLSNATFKDLDNTKVKQADLKAEIAKVIVDAAKGKVDATKVDVEVELLNAPAKNADYNKGDAVKAKVTLKSKTDAKAVVTAEFEGNVAK